MMAHRAPSAPAPAAAAPSAAEKRGIGDNGGPAFDAWSAPDWLVFDDEASLIDRMGRSSRRKAIKERGYPAPRYVGLRAAWLCSEILSWVRAQPTGQRPS